MSIRLIVRYRRACQGKWDGLDAALASDHSIARQCHREIGRGVDQYVAEMSLRFDEAIVVRWRSFGCSREKTVPHFRAERNRKRTQLVERT